MKLPISFLLVSSAALSAARPLTARSLAAPLALRTVSSLDQAATAEAQQKDNTATRAFTGQPIKTSDGKCWTVDPLSGDFRENLTPVQLLPCNGSDGQKWDVITSGKHDNVAGTALIVSSLTNACLNFDDRRAAGDKVILFSCGGRADGGGQVTDSQLFGFNGFQGPFTLVPRNKAGTCMTVNGARLDEATCNNSAGQVFTIGSGASSGSNTPPPSNNNVENGSGSRGASTTKAATTSAAQTTAAPPRTNNNQVNTVITNPILDPSKTVSVSRAGGVLNPTAAAQANQRDDTATRAFSNVQLKSANGQCLFIDPTAGDFRENLIPVQLKACDNSDNEKFDIITSGKHNNAKNSMLIVSSLTQGCLNFDDRRAAGDKVIMFSCGGRADGDGQTTDSQLFPFTGSSTIVLAPENAKNQTCLVPNGSVLDVAACTGGNDQTFTIVGGGAAAPPPPVTTSAVTTKATTTTKAATTTQATTSATTTAAPPPTNNASSNNGVITNPILDPSKTVSVSRAGGVLNPTAAAQANQRDDTATRAFSNVQLKSANGQCLFIDPTAGDFRENLIPVQVKPCDNSDNEKFDIITAGKHNNAENSMLIVSSLTQGCLNFDDRRAAGDQVIMFSCGGRADGDGGTQNAQLFPFGGSSTIVLAPENANNKTCLVPKGGLLDVATCTGGNNQLFTIVGGGAAAPPATTTTAATKTTVTSAAATTTAAPPPSNNNGVISNTILDPSKTVSVSRAGGVLNPTAAAEANQRDNTATRAFSNVQLKSANGQCLFIDPTAGDFRENLIPVQLKPCDGSDNEKFDIITAGKHNNAQNSMLVVSALTQGCLNFDDRRAAGDKVIMFSCGGRADGEGQTTDSQLFPFTGSKTIVLAPENAKNQQCLVPNGSLLDVAACTGGNDQTFTIV